MTERLADDAARERIVTDLGSTLFVEAGAGSGKTTALVDRVIALVTVAGVELRSIAAITFTEKAGAELRDRLRRQLERGTVDDDALVAARCRGALDQLDGAAVGTLHAFAQRILTEHPVEAGLPPAVEVLDEVSSGLEFERRWRDFQDKLLSDAELEQAILLLVAGGVRPDALRVLALAFDDNWDLVAERVTEGEFAPVPVRRIVDEALRALDDVVGRGSMCRGPDKLLDRLGQIADHAARLRSITDDVDLVEALRGEGPSFRVGNLGQSARWGSEIKDVQAEVGAAGAGLERARALIGEACIKRIAGSVRRFTLGSAEQRRAAGRLEFHDLLVMARALLRDPRHGAAVRARLHRRYERILLDEFQDTDPIQIELAVRIAADDAGANAAGDDRWDAVAVAPGHLFLVGDPKQSIYRFRRADIAIFTAARARFGPAVELTTNFRAGRPVIDWVNNTFVGLLDADSFVRLDPHRPGPDRGLPVSLIGRDPWPPRTAADEMRAGEAADVVTAVSRIIAEGWSVDDRSGGWRDARLGDIAILVPARTSLPFLEDALDSAGIGFRAEASSLVYASRAVRDLLMVLRAVDDPTDHLRVAAALRTPLMGCGDDDLFQHRVVDKGTWNFLAEQPPGLVGSGLAYLKTLHDERLWAAPSELLARIATDRRAFELGFAEGRPRDVWRRLRFVIDQARAWFEASGASLRDYLRWVDRQTAEGARVAEAILPETDDDAVRIMTIHAAKGLEFPIAIVSGLTTLPGGRPASAQVVFPPEGGVGYKLGSAVTTREYEAFVPIDEQMAADERVRLMYVACTRARDHLVFSVHRKDHVQPDAQKATNAELLVAGMGPLMDDVPSADDGPSADAAVGQVIGAPLMAAEPLVPFEEWEATRADALTRASRPTTIAATALTADGTPASDDEPDAGLVKRPRDLDLPPWLKGRYGTSVGRAVHGVLQTIDLATGDRLDSLVAGQCEAEAIPGEAETVRVLVGHALGSDSVRQAANSPHWREVYACTPLAGGRLLEGYVDLLYRSKEGLVVVDHKTASTADPSELDRRVQGYRMQGASYALAVAAATGERVVRVVFLFLTPAGAVERELADLDEAVEEVRSLAALQAT